MQADLWSYDFELAPNFFSATFKKIGTDIIKRFYIHNYNVYGMTFSELRKFVLYPNRWFIGYNNLQFDDILLNQLLKYDADKYSPDLVVDELYDMANIIIDKYKDYDEYKRITYAAKKKPFRSLDVMKISRLFKSLKSTAINIKWKWIKDLPYTVGQHIKEEEIPEILDYNLNDVEQVEALFLTGQVSYGTTIREEINLRIAVGKKYGVDVMNEDRSGMANRLLERFYSQHKGVSTRVFKDFSTSYPNGFSMKRAIPKDIRFKSSTLDSLLTKVRNVHITDSKTEFRFRIRMGNTLYDMGKGGLHSVRKNEIFKETDDIEIIDCDVMSFYPKIMLKNKIKPSHLENVFLKILRILYQQRITAKLKKDKVTAEALKITINSIFGKLGEDKFWLYDLLAMYRVTISGQLYLLMLIEKLEMAGFEVVYANTDGITTRVLKTRREEYYKLCREWEAATTFTLEYTNYKKAVIRDVNNYLIFYDDIEKGPQVKMKGAFDTEGWRDVVRSFNMPIIAYAIRNYFENGISVKDTIENHRDPLDFCLSQNSGKEFSIEMDLIENGQLVRRKLQKTNRYLVSNNAEGAGAIYKVKDGNREGIAPVTGQFVQLMNDLRTSNPHLSINKAWYVQKALEEILPFEAAERQLTLF